MWKENGTTLSSYVKKKCEENEDGIWQIGNVMFACDEDGNLYFTDSQGNTSVISIADNGEVTIEGGVSSDGSIKDDKAPSISATSTTNSITFVAKDILSGVAGWNYSTTNAEPTSWNEVSPMQKSFTHTIENLANNITYYIWAKDANGNASSAREVNTKDFDEFRYEVSWENATATIMVSSPNTGVQYLDESKNWVAYTGPLTVESGTVVFFRVSDGYNNIEFESVKPVLSYTISYNANGGSGTMASSQHEYGIAKKLTANGFCKTGYTFAGWATSESGAEVYDNEQSIINLASSNGATVTLFAKWTANTNTTYKVIHQQMNVDGNGYTTVETENLTGTTDANVIPSVKTYIGFTSPAAQTKVVEANGNMTITYQYTRNKYTINFNSNGGTACSAITNYYGASVSLPSTTRSGCQFTGWSSTYSTMPAQNVRLNATWKILAYLDTSTPTAYNHGGFTINSASNYTMVSQKSLWEKLNIPIKNCAIGKNYTLTFTFGVSNASYINMYSYSYNVSNSQLTVNSDQHLGNAFSKDTNNHSYTISFEATSDIMYLNFNLSDLIDGSTYSFYLQSNNIVMNN